MSETTRRLLAAVIEPWRRTLPPDVAAALTPERLAGLLEELDLLLLAVHRSGHDCLKTRRRPSGPPGTETRQ